MEASYYVGVIATKTLLVEGLVGLLAGRQFSVGAVSLERLSGEANLVVLDSMNDLQLCRTILHC